MSIDNEKRKPTNCIDFHINAMTMGKEFDKFKEEYSEGLHESNHNTMKIKLAKEIESLSIKVEDGGIESVRQEQEK